MAQVTIKAYWSEDYGNTDGVYTINFPDGTDFHSVIINAQQMLEEARDNSKDDFIESNKESLKFFNCTEDDYEELADWYGMHANCSLCSVLPFICEKLPGWSWDIISYETYDLDYLNFD